MELVTAYFNKKISLSATLIWFINTNSIINSTSLGIPDERRAACLSTFKVNEIREYFYNISLHLGFVGQRHILLSLQGAHVNITQDI